jgi:hypothetical protein
MRSSAKYQNAILKEVIDRQVTRAKMWTDALSVDGYPVGTVPKKKDDELQYLAAMRQSIPDIAQRDPGRAEKLLRRIAQLTKGT